MARIQAAGQRRPSRPAVQAADFDYQLPDALIAHYPSAARTDSRMLVVDPAADRICDRRFTDLAAQLQAGDLLVLNDTRVMPARLYGRKTSGGAVELMVERLLGDDAALVQTRASKPVRVGQVIEIPGPPATALEVSALREAFRVVRRADGGSFLALLEGAGHMPLPPYIQRPDQALDRERYQSVFAREAGAVAAPTASLHFDQAYLKRLRQRRVEIAYLTLHVGAGTFQPLRGAEIATQRLHREWLHIAPQTVAALRHTRARGGRIVAVGTTVCRALETWAGAGSPAQYQGETDLFIMPGFSFSVVDALLTNFHLPRSSLLMLVCAFAGTPRTLAAYRHAVVQGYRFYSYGDAMFLAGRAQPSHV